MEEPITYTKEDLDDFNFSQGTMEPLIVISDDINLDLHDVYGIKEERLSNIIKCAHAAIYKSNSVSEAIARVISYCDTSVEQALGLLMLGRISGKADSDIMHSERLERMMTDMESLADNDTLTPLGGPEATA